jgi:hypothetical protein
VGNNSVIELNVDDEADVEVGYSCECSFDKDISFGDWDEVK